MTSASIPVDLRNPGQVFASLGFLEAADVLCDDAQGGFAWDASGNAHFVLTTADMNQNAFEIVLTFLARASVAPVAPSQAPNDSGGMPTSIFPTSAADPKNFPVRLTHGDGRFLTLSHWCDGSSRDPFKLHAGKQSAIKIVTALLGEQEAAATGIRRLWKEHATTLIADPFKSVAPLDTRFGFDASATWTQVDAGYSPDRQDHPVQASPIVEFLAALGLEHARPQRQPHSQDIRYATWRTPLCPHLARAALGSRQIGVELRAFHFALLGIGPNKQYKRVTFAREIVA